MVNKFYYFSILVSFWQVYVKIKNKIIFVTFFNKIYAEVYLIAKFCKLNLFLLLSYLFLKKYYLFKFLFRKSIFSYIINFQKFLAKM